MAECEFHMICILISGWTIAFFFHLCCAQLLLGSNWCGVFLPTLALPSAMPIPFRQDHTAQANVHMRVVEEEAKHQYVLPPPQAICMFVHVFYV